MTRALRVAIAGLGTVGRRRRLVLLRAARSRRARGPQGRMRPVFGARPQQEARSRCRHFRGRTMCWLAESDADVVVELIGGEDGRRGKLVERALSRGSMWSLPTRRCSPIAAESWQRWPRERPCAEFEAAVAGGIPIVKALRESLIAYDVVAVGEFSTAPAISS